MLIVVVDVVIAIVAVDLYSIATLYSFIFQSPLNRINVWGTPQINVHRRQVACYGSRLKRVEPKSGRLNGATTRSGWRCSS